MVESNTITRWVWFLRRPISLKKSTSVFNMTRVPFLFAEFGVRGAASEAEVADAGPAKIERRGRLAPGDAEAAGAPPRTGRDDSLALVAPLRPGDALDRRGDILASIALACQVELLRRAGIELARGPAPDPAPRRHARRTRCAHQGAARVCVTVAPLATRATPGTASANAVACSNATWDGTLPSRPMFPIRLVTIRCDARVSGSAVSAWATARISAPSSKEWSCTSSTPG